MSHPMNTLWEFTITIASSSTPNLIFDGSSGIRAMPPMQLSGLRITNTNQAGTVYLGTNDSFSGAPGLTTTNFWKQLGPREALLNNDVLMGRGQIQHLAIISDGTSCTVRVEVLQ